MSTKAQVEAVDQAALERRALAGDDAAWNELFARHNRRVVVSLLARGVPLAKANEYAQDAWTIIIEKARQGRLDRLAIPGLVIRQARFLSIDGWRASASLPFADEDSLLERVVDPAADIEDRLASKEELERVLASLDRCSDRARQIFLDAYQGDRPHEEIARDLGISTQRVRQTLCEVRSKLRAAVEGR